MVHKNVMFSNGFWIAFLSWGPRAPRSRGPPARDPHLRADPGSPDV